MSIPASGRVWGERQRVLLACLLTVGCACSSGPAVVTQYEYDETIELSLDGSATVYVNASIPALIALRGLDLNPHPRARLDRAKVRSLYSAPGVTVRAVSTSRRAARRFIHVTLEVANVRQLSSVRPLSWSRYQLDRRNDEFVFIHTLAGSAQRQVRGVEWTGREHVAFRVRFPSRVRFHNAGENNLKRGNILVWEGPLADRLAGAPARFEARLDTESILYRTLWLFLLTFLAAVTTLAAIVWRVMRQGRKTAPIVGGPQPA